MSQSTSTDLKDVLHNNRDPRYFRPTYIHFTYHNSSMDSIICKIQTMTVQIMKILKLNETNFGPVISAANFFKSKEVKNYTGFIA